MAFQSIGLGTSADDGTGDSLRVGGDKVNDNFSEIYTLLGTGSALTTGFSTTASVVTLSSAVGTFTTLTPAASDGTALGSASLEFSDLFLADASTIKFGADQDVILTHVADTGLLLNAAMKIQFRDAAIHISSTADGDLSIAADDEIDLTSTLIDINGNVEISGTTAQVGVLTTTATQVATGGITSGSNIVSDTDSTDDLGTTSVRWANLFVDGITATDQITATGFTGTLDGILGSGTAAAASVTTLTASGIIKTDDTTAATSTTDGSLQTDGGLSVAADAVIGDDLLLLSDAAVLSFGANSEVTLTHVHDDGLLLNTDMQLQFRDSAINIRSDADGDLDINADDEIELNSTLIDINGAVQMSSTALVTGVLTTTAATVFNGGFASNADSTMGTNKKIVFRDAAIHISSTADGDLSIAADDEIDLTSTLIDVNGNLDVSGTYTGAGVMTTGGNIVIPDGGNIGSASDTNAMSISSIGLVSLSATNAIKLNVGTTAQRPTGAAGLIRYNSTTSGFEGYGAAWGALGGGATGGGGDTVFVENQDDVTTNYSITAGSNALSVGPIIVETGVTVTVPTGQRWLIL